MEQFVTNAGDKLKVHNKSDCNGPVCPIHQPTPHHMREWKLIWRGDRGIFERLCPEHGVGHPDPDDMASQIFRKGYADGVHGCCGCCHPVEMNEIIRLNRIQQNVENIAYEYTMVDLDPELHQC